MFAVLTWLALAQFTDLPTPSCPAVVPPAWDPIYGLPPGDTGTRQVFHTDNVVGHEGYVQLYYAAEAAAPVGGAVVIDRIIDMPTWHQLKPGVMYTGGGLRRWCGTYTPTLMQTTANPYAAGIVIDSVLFDGNWRSCGSLGKWADQNALSIRGRNTVRNSIFYDSPSESITSCGGYFEGNWGIGLAGSFLHKSCAPSQNHADVLVSNYVDGVNLLTDAVLGHSEGAITFSANAGSILLTGNVFKNGREGVFGTAGHKEEGVLASGDCYDNFPRLLQYYDGARPEMFQFPGTRMRVVGP